MKRLRRAGGMAVVVLLGAASVAAAEPMAAAEPVAVLGSARPAWLPDLLHELGAGGFVPRLGQLPDPSTATASQERCALRISDRGDAINVLSRRSEGQWTVDEHLALGASPQARRRAIVRAVEILRARRAWPDAASVLPAPAPTPPTADMSRTPSDPPALALATNVVPAARPRPASPPPAAARLVADVRRPPSADDRTVPAVELARSAPGDRRSLRPSQFQLGLTSTVGGAAGGLGAVATVGVAARWLRSHLVLWTRGELAPHATTVTGAEGEAEIRAVAASVGGGFSPREAGASRLAPFIGGEASGHALRVTGQGGPGYRGQNLTVAGLSVAAVGGLSYAFAQDWAVVGQGRAGFMLLEPLVTFAGRPVSGWHGPSLSATVELSWRF